MKIKGESIFSLFLIFVFSFIYLETKKIPPVPGGPYDVGTQFFPMYISLICIILSIKVFISSLFKQSKNKEKDADESLKKKSYIFISMLLILFLYSLILTKFGFIISTIVFLLVLYILLNKYKTNSFPGIKKISKVFLFFSLLAVSINYLFENVFKVILP